MQLARPTEDIPLLLSHWEDGRPFLPDGLNPTGLTPPPPRGLEPATEDLGHSLFDPGKNLNDLSAQGWGLLYPEGQARLLDALRVLIDWRAAEQGRSVPCLAVPPGLDHASAQRWLEQRFRPHFRTEQSVPLYVLILGELHEIALELQQRLSLVHAVGRLALMRLDGTHDLHAYEAYAAKVVAFEAQGRQAPTACAPMAAFTTHDGSMAIQHGYQQLISPLLRRMHEDAALDLSPATLAEHGHRGGESPESLLRVAGTLTGGFLFTLSHGVGIPEAEGSRHWQEEQRRFQGSMSFGARGRLTADELGTHPFVPGGLWLYFACFGAGTPSLSAYWHWLRALSGYRSNRAVEAVLKTLAPGKPFTSRLSQAALANPNGPSAIIAHIDLAWQHSYALPGEGPDLDRFMRVPYHLALGRRVGLAFSELVRERTQRMVTLGHAYDRSFRLAQEAHDDACRRALLRYQERMALGLPQGPLEWPRREDSLTPAEGQTPDPAVLQLWMGYHDLSGFLLLGDPATLLPTAADWRRAAPVPLGVSAQRDPPASPRPAARRQTPAPSEKDPPALARIERTIAECIMDGEVPQASARRLGVSRETLQHWVTCFHLAGRKALETLLHEQGGAPGEEDLPRDR